MATYSRVLLSGSTNGKPIPVTATATAGTTIHTAVAGTSSFDELYLWASNVSGSAVALTIEWGGTTDPGEHIVKAVSIPANSPPIPIVTGQVLQNGLVIGAFAGTTAVINITGYVNRIASGGLMPHVNSNFSGANGLVIADAQRAIEAQVFGPRRLRPFDPQAGSNITIAIDAMGAIITSAGGTDSNAVHVNVANEISGITEKTTLANDDLFIIEDSAAAGVKKKVKKSNVGGGGAAADDSSSVLASRTFVNPVNSALRLPGRVQVGVDGSGSVPTTGILLDFVVPANMTITGWEVLADVSGSIQFDLWKSTYGGFPTTAANTITGSDKPNLVTQQKNSSTALTGWTKSWTEGDIVRVNIDSDSVLTRALLVISYTKP